MRLRYHQSIHSENCSYGAVECIRHCSEFLASFQSGAANGGSTTTRKNNSLLSQDLVHKHVLTLQGSLSSCNILHSLCTVIITNAIKQWSSSL